MAPPPRRRLDTKLMTRLTYANVMSTLAMFAALAGGAYAAATIGSRDIEKNAVRSKHIKPTAVKSKQIKDGAVSGSKIQDDAVTTGVIAADAVTTDEIAANAVTTGKITDGSVITGTIADGAVTGGKIAGDAVNTGTIADGAVTAGEIADGAVTAGKVADQAVSTGTVADFSLRLHDLGGNINAGTRTVAGAPITVDAGDCKLVGMATYNPAPSGMIGSLVVGYLTNDQGGAVLNNGGVVVPTMISATSQGGAVVNLMVCASSTQTIPIGSVFHYSIIGP